MTLIAVARPPQSRPPALELAAPRRPSPVAAQPPLPLEGPRLIVPTASEVPAEAVRAAQQVALALAEVLAGARAAAQLQAVLPDRLGGFVEHLVRSRHAVGLRLASLRVQAPRPGVAEASLRLGGGAGSRAGALRLELHDGRWLCVALELGLSGGPSRPARGTA